MVRPPIVVAPYDAELFGHWWYEGPIFLEEVLRAAAREPDFETVTPSEYLDRYGATQTQRPNPSTWGDGGTSRVLRGGAWNVPGEDCRAARRLPVAPHVRDDSFGFRVVLPDGT